MNKKLDESISIIQFLLKKKKKRIEDYSRKSVLTENEKIFIGDETQMINACEVLIKEIKNGIAKTLGKLPPQADDLEKKVLGAIILESQCLPKVRDFLKYEHFYTEQHQEIYKACLMITPLDLSTMVIQLRKNGTLEAAGGAYYLAELTSLVSQATHIEFHSRILIEFSIKRKLIQMCGEVLEEAYKDPSDCFEVLALAEKEVNEIKEWIK
jgi:replicative DNA helicase